jgi:outer membrane biosynthesis protein TonB
MIETRLLMRAAAGTSIVGHMVFLTLGLLFADARPFDSRPTEAIAVDIVTPEEAKELPKPAEQPKAADQKPPVEQKQPAPIDFSALTAPIKPDNSSPQSTQQVQPSKSQPAAAPAPPPNAPPASQQAKAAPQEAKPPGAEGFQPMLSLQAPSQPPPPAAASPGQPTVEPDVTVKYGVMLGLPAANGIDGVEAPAFEIAKIEATDVSALRRHLKTCSSLPASVAPSDKVRIVLRIMLSREGRLMTEPALIEASASAKGPVLMQKAMQALQACQPYAMLPADKYNEWKVLDLAFTPQDFVGG